jgi:hypothetical protein
VRHEPQHIETPNVGVRTLTPTYLLPQALLVFTDELNFFIDTHSLYGLGIGLVDAHLLASTQLLGTLLWTRDKRLLAVAMRLKLSFDD